MKPYLLAVAIKIVSMTAVALLLAACASKKEWYKDGATQEQFYMDQGQCKAQAFSVTGGDLMQVAIVFDSCMQGKGWYQRDAG